MKRKREILYENDEIQIIKVYKKRRNILPEKIEVYTDGACSNNGNNKAKAGIGVHFTYDGINDISESLPGEIQTNNRAEIYAVIRALEELLLYNENTIIVYTDSRYVEQTLNNNWKRNKNNDLWNTLDLLITSFNNILFKHVKGHSGIEGNEIADQLAKNAIK